MKKVMESALWFYTDPFVQAGTFTQSYNRYSYAFNNPLAFTDPSGYVNVGAKTNPFESHWVDHGANNDCLDQVYGRGSFAANGPGYSALGSLLGNPSSGSLVTLTESGMVISNNSEINGTHEKIISNPTTGARGAYVQVSGTVIYATVVGKTVGIGTSHAVCVWVPLGGTIPKWKDVGWHIYVGKSQSQRDKYNISNPGTSHLFSNRNNDNNPYNPATLEDVSPDMISMNFTCAFMPTWGCQGVDLSLHYITNGENRGFYATTTVIDNKYGGLIDFGIGFSTSYYQGDGDPSIVAYLGEGWGSAGGWAYYNGSVYQSISASGKTAWTGSGYSPLGITAGGSYYKTNTYRGFWNFNNY